MYKITTNDSNFAKENVAFWCNLHIISRLNGEKKTRGMLVPLFLKTVEMLNRCLFLHICGNAIRLRMAIGYNNGKYGIFLCNKHKTAAGLPETLPSLILAKKRRRGYTKANLRGTEPERS